ncbi:Uncharacterized protein involved in outer membrane biogenesis [Monaibacterium marinum]|uniref:Uncharacterized protein involved in outer membrane biogenesis n=1 Tax=Pontivivens marinum TaxID=1690039 RepID=A0A2C9CW36_9RHOB|nr:AsmA family protein [Monaibacterium marinum]SOH95420.1 Uncharacterized protein involved in outer membrane biogenesis [Monaibacterium marinum]
MRGTIGRLFLVLGILGVVFITALFVALPTERIAEVASNRLEAATGRKLTLTGGFQPSLWPDLGISTGPLTVSNADWAQGPEMLRAQGATIAVSPMALLSGRIEIRRLSFDTPQINLEIAPDGRANWQFANDNADPVGGSGGGSTQRLAQLAADITNGTVRLTDYRSGRSDTLDQIDLEVAYDADDRQAMMQGAVRYNMTAFQVNVEVESDLPLAQLSRLDIAAQVTSDVADISARGQIADVSVGTGDASFEVEISSVSEALNALGLAPLPDVAGVISDVRLDGTIGLHDSGFLIEVAGRADRDDVRVDLNLNADGVLGAPLNTEFAVTAQNHLSASFAGTVDVQGHADGRLAVDVDSIPWFAGWAGAGQGDLPHVAQGPVALRTLIALRPDGVQLSQLSMELTELTVEGDLGVGMADTPNLTGALRVGHVVLADAMVASDAEPAPAQQSGAWDQSALPWQMLRVADLDLSLVIASLDTGVVQLGQSDVGVLMRDGQGQIQLNRIEGFGGDLSGNIRLNADSQRIESQIAMRDIRIEQVLAATTQTDRVEGSGNLSASLTASGANFSGLTNTLNGPITVDLADGALRGVNLAEIGRNLTGAVQQDAKTDFTEAHISMGSVDGVLQIQQLSALSPLLRLTGEGTVSLPARRLNVKLIPRVTTDLTGQGGSQDSAGVAIPVEISGPWSDLSYRPDLGAYEDALRAQADDAVERFRSDLAAGQDPESAARGALSDFDDAIRGEGGGLDVLRGLFK